MKENIVKDKSFVFAIRIVNLRRYLIENKKESVLSKQLLRSGTSVGAMIREAEHAETKNDFKHKMAIAQKEINETIYWLELLHATDYISSEQFNSINNDAIELIKLITSILKTTKSNLQ
ncbi:four helix bundle protein [Paludibacter jiangxiensis]|uniref:Four helix bundle protein n=1 Tax=Paludibacter jiangxiensis TaxID=681398 RepID=A0A170ZFU8_9BACT|nr:four helix bundle protein [Paludibacter jiangxiensis]GAT62630.1 four helix bundle protein [Paludibacter jiangxiensis]